MTDPYQVLGISRDASNDEIKKAYRKLSRQYHPDANINNPNKDLAEAKFKEVQQAYDQIMYEKEHGTTSGYGQGYGGFNNQQTGYGGFGYGQGYGGYYNQQSNQGQYQNEDMLKFQAAANYINAGSYTEALHVLDSMTNRSAQWYYLSAIANARMGNNINATDFARTAVNMEPNNLQYRQLLSQLESGGQWYQDMGQNYGMHYVNLGDSCYKVACTCMLLQCCCPGGFYCC